MRGVNLAHYGACSNSTGVRSLGVTIMMLLSLWGCYTTQSHQPKTSCTSWKEVNWSIKKLADFFLAILWFWWWWWWRWWWWWWRWWWWWWYTEIFSGLPVPLHWSGARWSCVRERWKRLRKLLRDAESHMWTGGMQILMRIQIEIKTNTNYSGCREGGQQALPDNQALQWQVLPYQQDQVIIVIIIIIISSIIVINIIIINIVIIAIPLIIIVITIVTIVILSCGSDGKLYNNGCQMMRKNCGKTFQAENK